MMTKREVHLLLPFPALCINHHLFFLYSDRDYIHRLTLNQPDKLFTIIQAFVCKYMTRPPLSAFNCREWQATLKID